MGTNKVRGGESLCTTFYFKNDVNNDSLRNVTFYSVDSLRGKGGEDEGRIPPWQKWTADWLPDKGVPRTNTSFLSPLSSWIYALWTLMFKNPCGQSKRRWETISSLLGEWKAKSILCQKKTALNLLVIQMALCSRSQRLLVLTVCLQKDSLFVQ